MLLLLENRFSEVNAGKNDEKAIYVYEQRLNWRGQLLGARVWVGACRDLSRFVKALAPGLQMTRFEMETGSKEPPLGVRSPIRGQMARCGSIS